MEPLILKPTRTTPLVWLDATIGRGTVAGSSLPENAVEFYGQVIDWLDRYATATDRPMRWEFRLHYFNTSSMKGLYQVLSRIKKSMDQGHAHTVVWDIEQDDEFMLEAGEGFMELLGITMELRTLSEEQLNAESNELEKAMLRMQGI